MKRPIRRVLTLIMAALMLSFSFTAAAEELEDGIVAGLPEKLVVLDSEGNSANENGEYFFEVEDMKAGEQYTKDIQIMNMREDKAYDIYLKIEPVSKQGEIDLENECTATITIGNETVYEGKVTGNDSTKTDGIGLGNYTPGQARNMRCTVVWNGSDSGADIDFGERTVTESGTTVTREQSGEAEISGEVEFRWIFCAKVDTDYEVPYTGFYSEIFLYVILFAAAVLLTVMIILVAKKKRKAK